MVDCTNVALELKFGHGLLVTIRDRGLLVTIRDHGLLGMIRNPTSMINPKTVPRNLEPWSERTRTTTEMALRPNATCTPLRSGHLEKYNNV